MTKAVATTNNAASPRDYTKAQLKLIRDTVAKDCNESEFDLFMEMARHQGLDPFRKQIYAIVTNKDKPDKRQLAVVTGIDGYRAKAARCQDYRPSDRESEITYDDTLKDPKVNPLGIWKATYTAYKRDANGEWHPVNGTAYWDEFAPLTEVWEYSQESGKREPTGRFELAKGKDNWRKMPRQMIAKCAEAQALRKGWPEEFSGLYVAEEMDQAMVNVTPSEVVAEAERDERMRKIGGPDQLVIQWDYTAPLQHIPIGQFADKALEFIKSCDDAATLDWWWQHNLAEFRRFWGFQGNDALHVKKAKEARMAELRGNEGAAA